MQTGRLGQLPLVRDVPHQVDEVDFTSTIQRSEQGVAWEGLCGVAEPQPGATSTDRVLIGGSDDACHDSAPFECVRDVGACPVSSRRAAHVRLTAKGLIHASTSTVPTTTLCPAHLSIRSARRAYPRWPTHENLQPIHIQPSDSHRIGRCVDKRHTPRCDALSGGAYVHMSHAKHFAPGLGRCRRTGANSRPHAQSRERSSKRPRCPRRLEKGT